MTTIEPTPATPAPVAPVAEAAAPAATPAGAPVAPKGRLPARLGWWLANFLWKGAEERELRAHRTPLSARQAGDLERAFAVQRLAAAAIVAAADDRRRADASLPAVIGLLRDSVYWALCAAVDEPIPASGPEAIARPAAAAALVELVPDEAARERVRAAVTEPSDAWARRPRDEQQRAFTELAAFSTALLRRLTFTRWRLRRILMRRMIVGLIAAAGIFAAVEVALTVRLQPSLTEGKPWRASSALDVCRPKDHYCADAVTDIFFCTTDEPNPWVEYDLGERQTFRHLVVKNRADCCPDRAVPLALEVSDDQREWHEVATRAETFATWRADFPAAHARYARLRAQRRTILHLDAFDLYP